MSSVTVEIKGKEDVSTHAKKAEYSLRGLVQEQNNMVKGFATAAVAGAAVTAAIRQIAQAVDQCVTEFAANERATLAFNAAIKGSGTISAAAGNGLAQFAEEIAIMTGQTGESVQSMETLLVTSGRTESEVRKLISAAVDMSAATGTDLNTAVEQLNATFSGTEGRLGKLIPELQGLTKEQLINGEAVDIIAGKYDGLGDALQDSVDVSIKNYKNAMSDLKAELGGVISIGLTPLREWLTDLVRQWGAATSAARSYATVQKAIVGNDLKALVLLTDSDLKAALAKQQQIAQDMYAATVSSKSYDMGGGIKVSGTMLNTAYDAQLKVLQDIKLELSRRDEEALAIPKGIIPTTTGNTSSTVDPFQALVDSLRKELGPRLVDSGIDDVIASYFEESVSTAFEMIGTGGSSDSGIAEYQSPLFEDMFNELKETFQLQGTTKDAFYAARESSDAGNSPLQVLVDAMGPVVSTILSVVGSLGSVKALLDPIGTIIAGIMDILGPIIDTLLAPLVGILRILGQTLGRIIAPLFEMLGPIIASVAEAFVWIYNKVLRPVGNGIISVFNVVANIILGIWNGIVAAINAVLGWAGVHLSSASYRAIDQGHLSEISVAQLSAAGSASSTSSTTGANASYSQARDVTVNVSVTTSALVGDDGIRQFSLMIWREIKSAGVLGAA